jgi:TPP-dependent pyruvate/acetoin dehydrogenase alpha subunit
MNEELLRMMWLIRAFEERVGRLKRADEIPGLVHVSLGQEGVAAGVCTQLRDDEAVYSGHRAHGHALAKGCPPERVMAELMGRAGGLCGGLGGSMHLVDAARGFMGATGVVGGTVPLALGHTLTGRVAVVFFGDGAVQAGHFNESVNLAALWGAPLILVCENNGFAEFTPRSAHTVVERVSDVVKPYGIEHETVDGNDVLAVHAAFGRFLAAAREGRGPFLLECLTTRLSGHYEGDPHHRRDPEAVDPIARLDSDPALEAQARERVEAAVEFARASPWPTSAPVYA